MPIEGQGYQKVLRFKGFKEVSLLGIFPLLLGIFHPIFTFLLYVSSSVVCGSSKHSTSGSHITPQMTPNAISGHHAMSRKASVVGVTRGQAAGGEHRFHTHAGPGSLVSPMDW